MNMEQIAYLIDIAKTGSINATAKRMFSSQQAVSESIKRLENELNCTILERSKRGVTLTEDGKYVLSQITPMLEHYQTLVQHFQKSNFTVSGKLNIGVALFATNVLLVDLVFEMHRQHPDITLYTEELEIETILQSVLNKKMDFGLAGFSNDTDYALELMQEQYGNLLQFHPLYYDQVVCVMHKNNPLSSEKVISETHLSQLKYTCYNSYQQNQTARTTLHISSNTNIHKKFMREENTVCMLNTNAYKALFPEKEFVAVPVESTHTVITCLFHRKDIKPADQLIYQTFIHTAAELAHQL